MQDTDDFDRPSGCRPVHQEVTSATSVSRDVQRAQTRHDLIAGLRIRGVGTFGKFRDRLDQRVSINSRLSGTEIFGGPFQDIGKIELCGGAETNAPFLPGHETTIPLFGK
jgi:hypothetical protein